MKILQISDLHLYQSETTLMDMGSYSAPFSTNDSFQRVCSAISARENTTDLIIVSGDIAEEPTEKTYQRVAPLLNRLPTPCYCIAGNHDQPKYIEKHLNTVNYLDKKHWRIIFLNTHHMGHSDGHLSLEELKQLETHLKTDKYVLIVMHHHPVPIHSRWMDNLSLQQPERFLTIIRRYNTIKAVTFGHIHQAFDETHHNVRYLGSVSTCIQFHSHQEEMQFSDQAAGYREINLHSDGSIDTTIHFVK